MMFWLIAATTAAVTVPGFSPPPPHMHYEIRIIPNPQHMSRVERLQKACDLSKAVIKQTQPRKGTVLEFDLSVLRLMSCGAPNSN
jgi:hypothetical protein